MKKDTLAGSSPADSGPADSGPADGGSMESTSTILLVACYNLTDEALEKAPRPGITKRQYIAVTLDKAEAIRTECARKIWSSSENAPSSATYDHDGFLLCKIEPNLTQLGVTRGPTIPEFDHFLTGAEATEIIERGMARYDEVLAVSRAAYDKRANSNTVMITLTAVYDLTIEAHRELFLAGTPTTLEQSIDVTVSAREALRTGYIRLHASGCPSSVVGNAQRLLSKLAPNLEFVGVLRETIEVQQFDHVLTTEEATKFVVEEMARYDVVLNDSKAKIEADQKSRKENEEKEAEKHRREIVDFLIDLNYYMPMIKKGESCIIDAEHTDPEWFEMEGERVVLRYDLANANPESTWDTERAKATKEFFIKERQKRVDEVVLAWIKEHGSPQLKKAVFEAKIFEQVQELYHDERLTHDLPGWKFLRGVNLETRSSPLWKTRTLLEHEVDALIEATKKWPLEKARLCMVTKEVEDANGESMDVIMHFPFLIMECPWDKKHACVGLLLVAPLLTNAKVEESSKKPKDA
jgi:hypothetical protein